MFTEAEIDRIGETFAAHTLAKSEWTHASHFAAAIWALTRRRDAYAEMPVLIRAYNASVGTPNTDESGYHETITIASLRCAAMFLRDTATRADALSAILASRYGRSDWLLAYWTRERLFSPQARRCWVEPDIRDLPF
jgi:hypothetical protein